LQLGKLCAQPSVCPVRLPKPLVCFFLLGSNVGWITRPGNAQVVREYEVVTGSLDLERCDGVLKVDDKRTKLVSILDDPLVLYSLTFERT
jgi:hypothetical protein